MNPEIEAIGELFNEFTKSADDFIDKRKKQDKDIKIKK